MSSAPRLVSPALVAGLSLFAVGAAPKMSVEPVRDLDSQGYHVRLDLSGQVLHLSIPEERTYDPKEGGEAAILPTLRDVPGGFVSASMLGQKAKQFDDGLYAAVERAAQDGSGRFAGKSALLRTVARALGAGTAVSSDQAAGVVFSACRLGRLPVSVPAPLEPTVDALTRKFLADALRSKPIGFYTWSPALGDIFRQDRMLQSELTDRAGVERLARALRADPPARATYEAYLGLVAKLTNPTVGHDLRPVLRSLDEGRPEIPARGLAVFPASRSHEADLVKRLYGNRPIPEGFSLIDELIRRIRAGDVDLKPTETSGWYDYQTWALEPLVIPEKMPEASHLELDETYRKQLVELFKGLLALTRETHVKQLETLVVSAAPSDPPRVIIPIEPELAAEPLASFYRRRAESYGFLRSALAATFGPEALRGWHRQTADGPVAVDLATELDQMEALFHGASATARRQLGLAPDPGRAAEADMAAFRRWAAVAARDPDLARDARMMVPIFYDVQRRKTKVWVFLGWSLRTLTVNFAKRPRAEIFKNGKPVVKDPPDLEFGSIGYLLAYPVSAEVYVSQILNRDEFRKLCDTYKTRGAILQHLR